MRNQKVTKYVLFLVILGIILFFVREKYYIPFLGNFLDGLWVLVFVLVIYDLKGKYIYTLIPLLLGYSFEVFQYMMTVLGFNHGGYYPGYADMNDIVAYTAGYVIGVVLVYVFYKNK